MSITPGRFLRCWAAMLLVDLPLAAVMLTPGLMRSRVEAAPGLSALGISLFLVLPIVALWLSPSVAALVIPHPMVTPTSARALVRIAAQARPGAWWRCFGEYLLLFTGSQLIGGYLAWLVPHIWRNPRAEPDPDAPAWVLSYPNYALQGVSMYLLIALAHAWYAMRVLDLTETRAQPTRHASKG